MNKGFCNVGVRVLLLGGEDRITTWEGLRGVRGSVTTVEFPCATLRAEPDLGVMSQLKENPLCWGRTV